MKIISDSSEKTKKVGEMLAKTALKTKPEKALVFAFNGELGSGKTTFIQGFAEGLGVKDNVLSPTFNIFKRFEIKKNKFFKNLFHFDCYRIIRKNEILDLGFREIVDNSENIVVIEWADKIKKILPLRMFIVEIDVMEEGKRVISIK